MDRTTAAALALFGTSLGLLGLGGFVQLDDTSGFGYEDWVLPLGLLAGVVAAVGLGVALSRRTARRAFGAACAALAVVLVVLAVADDGFRFVWGGDEGELAIFIVLLALGAAALLTPSLHVSGTTGARRTSPWARVVGYLCTLAAATYAAFAAGAAHFSATRCDGSGGECDVAVLEGLLWAGAVLVLGLLVIVVNEVRLFRTMR